MMFTNLSMLIEMDKKSDVNLIKNLYYSYNY